MRPSASNDSTSAAAASAASERSAQPMTTATSRVRDRIDRERREQTAASLAGGTLEARLRPRHAGRPDGRVRGRVARGAPGALDRAAVAARLGSAPRRTQVHHDLVPVPGATLGHPAVRELLGRLGGQGTTLATSEHPGDVGVDHADLGLVGEGQHRSGGVRADARQVEQGLDGRRQPAAVLLDTPACGEPEVAGTTRIAESAPLLEHLGERSGSACARVGPPFQEASPTGHHPCGLGLLQHDLADQHPPRVTGVAPRQVAQLGQPRIEHRLLLGGHAAPSERHTCTTVSCG